MLKPILLRNTLKKRKLESTKDNNNNFFPHYVTFFIHDNMDHDAESYLVGQKGPFLFSSLNKAKLFIIKSVVRVLVGHVDFDEPILDCQIAAQARDEIKLAHDTQFYYLALLDACKVLVDYFYAKDNGDCGLVWHLSVLPQIDVYNEIDLL